MQCIVTNKQTNQINILYIFIPKKVSSFMHQANQTHVKFGLTLDKILINLEVLNSMKKS